MRSYAHPNAAVAPPTLSPDEWACYQALRAGEPMPAQPEVGTAAAYVIPDRLRLLAERWECDDAAASLTAAGVRAIVISRAPREPDRPFYVEAAVAVADHYAVVDAEAARRIAQRVAAGLSIDEAVARTLAQCEAPLLPESALRALERDADAHVRRLEAEDRNNPALRPWFAP